MKLPVYKLDINEWDEETGLDFVSLVESPAIQKDFLAFVEVGQNENKDEFITRCIKYVIDEGKSSEQAVAICNSMWTEHFAEPCPIATQDIKTNLANRQKAIDIAHYGPLNPNLPNDQYWKAKAKMFGDSVDDAKTARCKNCSFFNTSQAIKDCIAQGIGSEGGNPFDVINAGDLGYCEAFDFKCASARTCDAWVALAQNFSKVSFDWDGVGSTADGKKMIQDAIDNGDEVYVISARDSKENIDINLPSDHIFATGSNTAKVEKVKALGISKHYDNNPDVVKALGSIGQKFKMQFASYTDYPESAKANAERGIRLNEANGNKCATQVGKVRGQQLAQGEPISDETVQRIYSYLSRAKAYYDANDENACGTISYLLWGGEEMLSWTERKLSASKFAIQDEEKRIVTGAAMIADLPIYRRDDVRGEYYVVFDKESIFKIAKKWARGNKYDAVNTHHKTPIADGVSLFESYIIDRERGVMPPKGFEEVADGSWFVSYLIDNDEVWAKVKSGEFKGFSVEGVFDFPVDADEQLLEQMKSILSQWNGK